MQSKLILLFFGILLLFSCGGSKKNIKKTEPDKKEIYTLRVVRDSIKYREENIKNFEGYFNIYVKSGKIDQDLSGIVKIEIGKYIWLSLSYFGITMARVKITPKRFKIYEKINSTYIDKPFVFLQRKYAPSLSYKSLENLFLGGDITLITKLMAPKYKRITKTKLEITSTTKDAKKKIITEKINIINQNISSDKFNISLDFDEFKENNIPEKIFFKLNNNKQYSEMKLDYNKFFLNKESIKAPFKIPSRYKRNKNV